jgi:hypothetical protein
MALIREAAGQSDFGEGQVGLEQQCLGPRDARSP